MATVLELDRAVAAERDRIATDLHDTVGQLFVCIGLLARRYAEELPVESPWTDRIKKLANLADRGKWEIDQSIRALTFAPEVGAGLVGSLESFIRSFEIDSGIQVLFDVTGAPGPPDRRLERCLYRITHEALVNAWRHSRCALVRVKLQIGEEEVSLRIQDDGVGLSPRQARDPSWRGIRSMKRAVEEVEGTLSLTSAQPHGVVVEAHVPVMRSDPSLPR